jgi:Mn-dependent DtxR family transcriptional regulator
MRGSEEQVLRIIKELGSCKIERIAHRMVISPGYAGELCSNLQEDRYLSKSGPGEYALTPQGEKATNRTLSRGPIAVLRGA